MRNYYFLAPSLPPLVVGETPDITFEELDYRLSTNLYKKDYEKVHLFRRYFDLHNIRSLLLEEPLDSRGNLTEKELDEALLIHDILPEYVFDFLDEYESKEEKLRYIFGLFSKYFSEEIPKQKGFVKKYLQFERDWRLILLAFKAKRLKSDLVYELQFEDFSDSLVAYIMAQKDAEEFHPPPEYNEIKLLLESCGNDPWVQFKEFATYRFNKIEEMAGYPLFSIDWILGYLARLFIVEKWRLMDEEEGKRRLEKIKIG
ncbi:MAG: DUF2764 domain-containing protein [Chlamydiae bacterium]|nr:DUF2764 domain-containing protein [Chlamydiota bacterium]